MTLTKNKRTGRYQIRVKTTKGTKTISTRATSKAEARRISKQAQVQQLEEAAKVGHLTSEVIGQIVAGKRVTFEQAVQDYLRWMRTIGRSENTVDNHAMTLNRFLQGLEKKVVSSLSVDMVNAFINEPGRDKVLTRQSKLSYLNGFCMFAAAQGWILGNPARLVRVRSENFTHEQKEKRVRRPFTEAEVKRLLAAKPAGSFWHAAIAIARYTGLRLGDICQLEWSCLDQPGKIVVWTEKRDKRVALPLEPEVLVNAIAAVPPIHPQYLFPEQREIIRDMKHRAILSTQFTRFCQSLDIFGKSFHDLRSSYVTAQRKAGIPIEHISVSVGHSSPRTTEGYIGKEG